MIPSFSDTVQTTQVEAYVTETSKAQPKNSGCGYWLRQIFCCDCYRKKKVGHPAAPLQKPVKAPAQSVPGLNLKKQIDPTDIALDIIGAVPKASNARAYAVSHIQFSNVQTFTSTTFSHEAPGEVSSSESAQVQVSVSISAMKTVRIFNPDSAGAGIGRVPQSGFGGIFSMLKTANDEKKAQI